MSDFNVFDLSTSCPSSMSLQCIQRATKSHSVFCFRELSILMTFESDAQILLVCYVEFQLDTSLKMHSIEVKVRNISLTQVSQVEST